MLGYELPWNNVTFKTECFIKLNESHLKNKTLALGAYESQKYRTYLNDDFIRSLATIRGVQITAEFAEAFEVVRWIY